MKFLLLTLIFLVGCDAPTPLKNPVNYETNRSLPGDIREFNLEDGTRCVIYKEQYSGGISCDWRH